MNGPAVPSLEDVQRITAEVLRRPEFADLGGAGPQRPAWLERVFAWLDSLEPLNIRIPGAGLGLKILLYALLGVLLFLLVRLIIRQTGGLRLGGKASRLRALGASLSKERGGEDEELGESLRRSELALAAGDARTAIRTLCRALLKLMADRGFLKLRPWKTNLAYLRECPKEAPAGALLRELTAAYSTVVYAHAPYDRARIEQLLAELRVQGGRG
jgi:hypothetical protein